MKKKAAGRMAKEISFQFTTEAGSEVFVAGSFNGWDFKKHPMIDNPNSGIYKATVPLAPGRYEYKFVVNGEWRVDPNCPEWVPNEHGTLNSVMTV